MDRCGQPIGGGSRPRLRAFSRSPLTDSNRRPPPYHFGVTATGRNPPQRFRLDFAALGAAAFANGCHWLRPLGSTNAPSRNRHRASHVHRRRQCVEKRDLLVRQRRPRLLDHLCWREGPSRPVSALDRRCHAASARVCVRAQTLERLGWAGSTRADVAADDDHRLVGYLSQHCIKSGKIPMGFIEGRNAHLRRAES
jgi:hypothetical protein